MGGMFGAGTLCTASGSTVLCRITISVPFKKLCEVKLLVVPSQSSVSELRNFGFQSVGQHAGEVLFDQLFFKCEEFFSKVLIRLGQGFKFSLALGR